MNKATDQNYAVISYSIHTASLWH